MHGSLHRWLFLPLLFAILTLFTFPIPAHAQDGLALKTLNVQLWPEFDQPSMLVIYDFTLAEGVSLPVDIKLSIPVGASLIAVAYAPSGSSLLNVPYQEPVKENGWQVVTVPVDTVAVYHIEYYAPLNREDSKREYLYVWPGDHAVSQFKVNVKIPVDTTEYTTDPQMRVATPTDNGQTVLEWETSNLEAGKELPIKLTYTKTSDRLSIADQPLETGVVDENTAGRISLSNLLPWILGVSGILLILTGGLYFWQASKGRRGARQRHQVRDEEPADEDIYCHQCGKRAQPADRFCRTCGTRLRKET
jgi:hypothetical protein